MTILLQTRDLTKVYGSGGNSLQVLKGVNLTVQAGEMIAIVGASGSGKTTLLQILGTLDTPSGGEIYYEGEKLLDKSANELARFRNSSIGFMFQFHHLLPDFTALENVMMPALIGGIRPKAIVASALDLLAQVELSHRANHKVGELSGGEQQRTALARALVMNPTLLLADEPTGNLDSRSGDIVFSLLHRLSRNRNLATVLVTHNTRLAEQMDFCRTLKDGLLNS
ncbi:ABC transporter ATP-binding protein [Desulforhopalus singaporensis]|uniref:Lipoprotein-releasing system ATP-binding protein n=1 Tax=Desulforhopalus singaporensis TaxID=91360 RepID=A0A1H0J4F7_9BACT|nr:ABC transporter ATP-binding protein [Desulforhopalus singaporensis]SDO38624.1 lipoprotein-releasing system ATP-binding protein [Desulforhopalus singaporensis]